MAKQRNPKGMGSFRKLPNGTHQWRQRVDGEERTVTAKTPSELKEKIKDIINLPIVKEKYKVSEWFEKWLKVYIKPLKKDATYKQYKGLYESHIAPEVGKRKLKTIKTYDLQNIIAKMNEKTVTYNRKNKKTGKIEVVDTGKTLSTWTMKHTRKILNLAFSQAVLDKVISENPCIDKQGKSLIKIPTKQAKKRKTLSTNELSQIFKSMKDSRWIWSVKFDLVTGLRRGELLALTWSDVDIYNRRLTVDKSNSSDGLGDTKSSKIHYVPLSDKAIEYLNKQKNMLISEENPILYDQNKNGINKKKFVGDMLVFPSKKGELLKSGSYYTMLSRFANKVDIKASPHCLRHTFVYMMRNSLSLKELQNALGHDESTTTLDIYGNMLDSTDKTASKIDDVFSSLDSEIEQIEEKKLGKVIQFKKTK